MPVARNRTADMARCYARRSAREVAVENYPETSDPAEANSPEAYGDAEALQRDVVDLAAHRLEALFADERDEAAPQCEEFR